MSKQQTEETNPKEKENKSKPISQKNLTRFQYFFFTTTILLVGLSIWILIAFFQETHTIWSFLDNVFNVQENNIIFFRIFVYSFIFLFAIVSLHLWTVYVGEAKAEKIGLETVLHCKYCGTKESGLVCPKCDSVQWDPKHPVSGTAIYIAHHRKHILATLLAVGLIGPTTFAFSRFNENVTRQIQIHESYEKEAENVMNSILKLRSYLHEFELLQQHRWENKNDDIKRFRLICDEYYKTSWYASRVIDYLKHSICDTTWRNQNNYTPLTDDKSQGYSCDLIEKRDEIMTALDISFIDYVNAFKIDYLNDSSDVLSNDPSIHNETMEKSKILFENTKVLACIIAELTFNHNLDKKDSDRLKVYDCMETLKTGMNPTDKEYLEFPWGNTNIK